MSWNCLEKVWTCSDSLGFWFIREWFLTIRPWTSGGGGGGGRAQAAEDADIKAVKGTWLWIPHYRLG